MRRFTMSWNKYEDAAKQGPWALFWKIFILAIAIIIVIGTIGWVLGWFSEAGKVAKDEFGPKAALEKYEWFINQANAIEKMNQDIALFDNREKEVDAQYEAYGPKSEWPPDIRVQYNHDKAIAREDLLAISSQYNNLVKEYNTQSEKFNWKPFQTDPRKPRERFAPFEYSTPE